MKEKDIVTQLGDTIGYGRIMQLCEEIWREKAITQGFPGSEHTTGACAAFMVTCPHPVKCSNGHCEICCGAGRITKGVQALIEREKALTEIIKELNKDEKETDNFAKAVINNPPQKSVSINSIDTALLNLPGVIGTAYNVNQLGVIEITVVGGDMDKIAEAIYQNLPTGVLTKGSTAVVIRAGVVIYFHYISAKK